MRAAITQYLQSRAWLLLLLITGAVLVKLKDCQ